MTSATKVVFTLKLMIDKILYTNIYLGSTLRKKENIYNTITSYLHYLLNGELLMLPIMFNLEVKRFHNFAFVNFTNNTVGESLRAFFLFKYLF